MANPRAVLISDVHYNLQTLPLADAAMRQAIDKANKLQVPLIVAGDLHDTKANIRGECANAMLKTFDLCEQPVYILRGNHDAINEKSEEHSLNFLARRFSSDEYGTEVVRERIIVDKPNFFNELGDVNGNSIWLIPYHHEPNSLRNVLSRIDKRSCVIMHQGLKDSHMGDYIQDHSAITREDVAGLRVISGHYHYRQTIDIPKNGIHLPNAGKWDYIGNPYSLSWGEANDPEKGFQVLYNDGTLEFVPTNLRRHIILNCTFEGRTMTIPSLKARAEDLLWVRITGPREELAHYDRGIVAKLMGIDVFKFTLHPLETTSNNIVNTPSQGQPEILDSIIDGLTNTSQDCKCRIKSLWRGLA